MKNTLYFILVIYIGFLSLLDSIEHMDLRDQIAKNHTETLAQIQKQIDANTKFINALEAVLKGE